MSSPGSISPSSLDQVGVALHRLAAGLDDHVADLEDAVRGAARDDRVDLRALALHVDVVAQVLERHGRGDLLRARHLVLALLPAVFFAHPGGIERVGRNERAVGGERREDRLERLTLRMRMSTM